MMHSYRNGFTMSEALKVLILVLMDDALVHSRIFGNAKVCGVLILVLMDDALVPP